MSAHSEKLRLLDVKIKAVRNCLEIWPDPDHQLYYDKRLAMLLRYREKYQKVTAMDYMLDRVVGDEI